MPYEATPSSCTTFRTSSRLPWHPHPRARPPHRQHRCLAALESSCASLLRPAAVPPSSSNRPCWRPAGCCRPSPPLGACAATRPEAAAHSSLDPTGFERRGAAPSPARLAAVSPHRTWPPPPRLHLPPRQGPSQSPPRRLASSLALLHLVALHPQNQATAAPWPPASFAPGLDWSRPCQQPARPRSCPLLPLHRSSQLPTSPPCCWHPQAPFVVLCWTRQDRLQRRQVPPPARPGLRMQVQLQTRRTQMHQVPEETHFFVKFDYIVTRQVPIPCVRNRQDRPKYCEVPLRFQNATSTTTPGVLRSVKFHYEIYNYRRLRRPRIHQVLTTTSVTLRISQVRPHKNAKYHSCRQDPQVGPRMTDFLWTVCN
ncbi:hypothetical protein VPH35_065962 [Triticum aestivum]